MFIYNLKPPYYCYKAAGFRDIEQEICELFGEKWKILALAVSRKEYFSQQN